MADAIDRKLARLQELRQLLFASTLEEAPPAQLLEKRLGDDVAPLPRWPSGLLSGFDTVQGGFSGLTLIGAEGGCGKSLLAMSCALENALAGACVFYLDAENPQGDQAARARAWFKGDWDYRQRMGAINGLRFHWLEVLPGMGWRQLLHHCSERMHYEHERFLLILDSVQTLSRLLPGRPLEVQSKIYLALNALVRLSHGQISALCLSELNKEGRISGLEGLYASTLALKITRELDEGEHAVRLAMLKNRNGPLRPDLGLYEIAYHRCTLMARPSE